MADSHFEVDETQKFGQEFKNIIRNLALSWDAFSRLRGSLIEMKDNAAAGEAVYAKLATRFGFGSNAAAHSSFSEIDSAYGNANAALIQCLNRHL